ncbi:MAG: exopolysaccharide biosynthesis polyprenyl glycosylphosphotransferase [Lachnospiraceae bacterium]|jgi:exopolysaccharide biosynthesis polyprenyl glycosylphosphotransferase|nr:exopolysaccharide biosynthesis polyprenyl glycosylphosphotransferase [Lachnospiraceae bacterium]
MTKHTEAIKRIAILALNVMSLFIYTGLYAYAWFDYYYPVINNFNQGIRLYQNGHILIILLYVTILAVFSRTYGSLKIGYLKPADVFLSQAFSLLAVNVISYFQISLMNNWVVRVRPLALVFLCQLVIAALWAVMCDYVYRKMFPPRAILFVYGEHPIEDIRAKFDERNDRFRIARAISITEGIAAVKEEGLGPYRGIVLWDIPLDERNELWKFFYGKAKRVYIMPRISDVLLKGTDQLHLFDTPILLTREYALTVEQRIAKRLIDILFSLILIVLTAPIMLVTALVIRLYDRGPALFRQTRCTAGGQEFRIIKFRSMRVDAESDGVARLAGREDERITPVGRFIRTVRIDELPQLFNILHGEMSFIGPRPERPELIAQYLEEMPEFAFRLKMKAGLAGYAQVYGKYNTTPYDKLKLDLTYIENYSLWLDLKLMLLTLKILLKPESAEGVGHDQPRLHE